MQIIIIAAIIMVIVEIKKAFSKVQNVPKKLSSIAFSNGLLNAILISKPAEVFRQSSLRMEASAGP